MFNKKDIRTTDKKDKKELRNYRNEGESTYERNRMTMKTNVKEIKYFVKGE